MNKCQEKGCDKKARFNLYKYLTLKKKIWVEVCSKHDREIALNNARILSDAKVKE